MSKKQLLFKKIEGCLWSMIDTYNYFKSINHYKLCQNFDFWNNVKSLCMIEWGYLKKELMYLINSYVPRKSGFFWRFAKYYGLYYKWPGIYYLKLYGAEKNSQEYNCLITLFNEIYDISYILRYSRHIYMQYCNNCFEIHLIR